MREEKKEINIQNRAPESAGTDRPEQNAVQADIMALIYERAQERYRNWSKR